MFRNWLKRLKFLCFEQTETSYIHIYEAYLESVYVWVLESDIFVVQFNGTFERQFGDTELEMDDLQ